jgi:glyoxylase-like metal-dependent hydrolase (beta-lactamase superfamily II)
MRRGARIALAATATVVLWPAWTARAIAQSELELLPVQGHVYMLAGAGGNITVQIGDQGVLLVDTGRTGASEKVLAAIRSISKRPIHYIINSNVDRDHTGGNAAVSVAGRPAPGVGGGGLGAPIIAHEHVLDRMSGPSGEPSPLSADFWPTITFFTAKKTLFFNDDPIEMLWQKAAHTDGDVMVFFRVSDVISAGDVFSTTTYPVVDVSRGGSIQGELDALNRIIDITIPRVNQMGGTRVIPGHGRLCNEADVVEYRDMATIVRDRVKALVDKGVTLDQVQAARPTYEYDPLYGSETGEWTTKMFVESVYRSLAPVSKPVPAKPAASRRPAR